MRLRILFSLFAFLPFFAVAQSRADTCNCQIDSIIEPDTAAIFPGGSGALVQRFLEIKVKPYDTGEGVQSKIYLQMLIDDNGKVVCACVKSANSSDFNRRVEDIAYALPNFIPARKDGKAVAMLFNMPIIICLK